MITKITTTTIDQMYRTALEAGAIGGKLCGAGGGGFLLLFVPPRKRRLVKRALHDLLYVPFEFDSLGSQITYYANEEPYYEDVWPMSTSPGLQELRPSRTRVERVSV